MRETKVLHLLRAHLLLGLILLAFFVLGVTYSVTTPPYEASDEVWHYAFVKYLADGHGLPVQQPDPDANVARQEGSEPPLYYLIGALSTFWIDTGQAQKTFRFNPHAQIGRPAAAGNKNMLLHPPTEDFPYRGAVLALHLVRLISVLMGTATVWLIYRIGREVFPSQRAIAPGAAALAAFNPQFLFISGSVDNDNLITLAATLTLFLLLRWVKEPQNHRLPWFLGLSLGAAALTKISGLGLLALVGLVLTYQAYRLRSWRYFVSRGLVIVGLTVTIACWWYLRNLALYGDPTGLSMRLEIVGRRSMTIAQVLGELEGLWISFWLMFGGFNVPGKPWMYAVFDAISLVAGLGLVAFFWRRWRARDAQGLLPLALLSLWGAVLFASWMRWTTITMGSTGRLLFPTLPTIVLLLSLGLHSLLPRLRWLLPAAAGLSLFIIAAIAPFHVLAPAYARPALLTREQLPPNMKALNLDIGEGMRLLGFSVEAKALPRLQPGQDVRLTLYWEALAPMDEDYSLFFHLFSRRNQPLGQLDTYPGQGMYPTSLWQPGQIVQDQVSVPVDLRAEVPTLARLETGAYRLATMQRLSVRGANGIPLGDRIFLGDVKLMPSRPVLTPPQTTLKAPMGDGITLEGVSLSARALRPGETLTATLHWLVQGKPEQDYVAFVHLVAVDGRPLAQHDGPPRQGDYPTSVWEVGEQVLDPHPISLEINLPPGRYALVAGLYDSASGQRLGRAIPLGAVDVRPE